ncbi:MAG TPA: DUF2064 domain-containing protein [Thermoanaerobaculia bacterium]|nr:DUF2064 domain-containing protein [Thermoanaerobaculia bacterium]
MSRTVVLFARSPEREALAKGLRALVAVPLFRRLIADWLRAARNAGAEAVVACEDEDRGALAAIAAELPRMFLAQRGATFGARLAAAAEDVFARGASSVLIAGIDAPPHALDRAFAALERGFAVVAPARDGGVNVIGLAREDVALLEAIEPRRRDVLRLCRAAFGAKLVELTGAVDIDNHASLDAARHDVAWRAYFAVASFALVASDHPQRGIALTPLSRPPPARVIR